MNNNLDLTTYPGEDGQEASSAVGRGLERGCGQCRESKTGEIQSNPDRFQILQIKLVFIKILLTAFVVQVGKELGLRSKQISSWLKKRNVG